MLGTEVGPAAGTRASAGSVPRSVAETDPRGTLDTAVDRCPSADAPADPGCRFDAPAAPRGTLDAPADLRGGLDAPADPAEMLAAARPGGALAVLLEHLDLDALRDADLVEVVAAASRLAGWVHAVTARAAATLAERPSMNPVWSVAAGGAPAEAGVAGDELAMRLACSRRSAARLVRHGRAYAHQLSATGDALAAGQVGAVAAGMIADRLADQPVEIALDVQDRVLPGAGRRTPTQLARDLEAALIVVDPGEAALRARRARDRRCVHRPRALPDGMASLTAVLPGATAARIDATLEAAARSARTCGDPRTVDQLRADGLRDLLLHTACTGIGTGVDRSLSSTDRAARSSGPTGGGLDAGTGAEVGSTGGADAADGGGAGAGTVSGANAGAVGETVRGDGCGAAPHHRTEIRVTVALSTLLGLDEQIADLAGYGPIDASTARALAAEGTWRRLVTDPLSGTVLDVGRTRYRPPSAIARHVRARDQVCARPGCSAAAESCDLDHTIEYHRKIDADHPRTHQPGSDPEGGATFRGTTGGTALPPPSPAATSPTSSSPPATRPPVTGSTTTGPPATSPSTTGPPALGRTAVDNLGPLCRRDHRLKTDGGYTLRQTEPGVFEWTSRTGHRYRVVPGRNGRHEHLGVAPSKSSSGKRPPLSDAPPPF